MSAGAFRSQPAGEPAQTYFGWQQDKVAFLFGLSGQRAVMIGTAVLAAIWPLAIAQLAEGILFWPVAMMLSLAAFVRIAGRTTDEWLAAASSYTLVRLRGQHKFASGAFAPTASPDAAAPQPMDLPGILAPVRILAARTNQGDAFAIVHHRYDRTYAAVARVRFPGIGLADSARRDQRVAGWGSLLAGLCTEGNPIIRVHVLQRILPESGAALRRWHTDHCVPGAPHAALEITSSLLDTATLATCQREAYLTFVMDERRAASAIRGAGGGSGGAAAVLGRHLRSLSTAIGSAELQVSGWLSPRDLAEVIRTAFDPHAIRPLAERRAAAAAAPSTGYQGLPPGVDPALAGPAAAEARPGSYLHDGAVSATYWVHDWPRSQVYATALAPLLGEGWHRRAFSLHLEPLGPRLAQREVMRERTARDVAVRMRQRTGQLVPEHERAALDRARVQDTERAAGHGLVRFTAYVTVTVIDPADLEDACAALEADAAAARIEVRRMWMAQDIGFAMSALPLGFGLPQEEVVRMGRTRTPGLPAIDLGQYLGATRPAPAIVKEPPKTQRRRPSAPLPPRRGWARPFGGRAPRLPVVPVFRGSTGQVQGLYPWLYGASMPPAGAYIGVDCLTGGAFSCHPIEWLRMGLITNPNLLVTGIPGAGKSGTIKALAMRLMAYGVRCFVVGDLKNEYAPLARVTGSEPVELGPGLSARLNPLDAGPLGEHLPADPGQLRERLEEIHRRRITLLSSLLVMRLGRALSPTEEAALSLAIQHAHGQTGHPSGGGCLVSPTIPEVWGLLRDPLPEMADELRIPQTATLREMIRPAADALGNMVRGSLSGLFDGPTTVRPDFSAPIQTVDLSRLNGRGDETVAMTLACVSSWGQAAIDEPDGPLRLVVRDELWRALRVPAMIRKIDSDLRLSRAQGTIQVLATHRLADFEAAGAAGSEEVSIATNLIASCDVRICLRQDTGPLAMTREVIGLTDTECAHIGGWTGEQIGRAVWKIGRTASHVVQVVLTPAEQRLYWTNERMAV